MKRISFAVLATMVASLAAASSASAGAVVGGATLVNEGITRSYYGPGNNKGLRVRHIVNLNCGGPAQSLTIFWGGRTNPKAHRFDLTPGAASVSCEPTAGGDPNTFFDAFTVVGSGIADGAPASIQVRYIDRGEPGVRRDRVDITITGSGGTLLRQNRFIGTGNLQANDTFPPVLVKR